MRVATGARACKTQQEGKGKDWMGGGERVMHVDGVHAYTTTYA